MLYLVYLPPRSRRDRRVVDAAVANFVVTMDQAYAVRPILLDTLEWKLMRPMLLDMLEET